MPQQSAGTRPGDTGETGNAEELLLFSISPSFELPTEIRVVRKADSSSTRQWILTVTAGWGNAAERSINLDADVAEQLCDRLLRLALPQPKSPAIGLDGTRYSLTFNHAANPFSISWWQILPAEWAELDPFLSQLARLARIRTTPV